MEIRNSVLQKKEKKKRAPFLFVSDPYAGLVLAFSVGTNYCPHPQELVMGFSSHGGGKHLCHYRESLIGVRVMSLLFGVSG